MGSTLQATTELLLPFRGGGTGEAGGWGLGTNQEQINMTSYLIAGPGEEPVSLAEAKAFARIDGSDEDALVGALIAAARLHVESLTGRALITQTWRLVLPCGDRKSTRLNSSHMSRSYAVFCLKK